MRKRPMKDLNTRIQQAQAKLNDLKAIARKQERLNDTRRKIIYGAAILQLLHDVNSEKSERLRRLLDQRITRESDRKFLGID